MLSSWRNIRPGYVGVLLNKASHKVTTGALEPGWAFINPLTQSIQEYPVTIQTYSMVTKGTEGQVEGDDSVKVQSSEGQQLNLDVVIQYQVRRAEAGALYEDWGGAAITVVEDRAVRQYTRSAVPVIAARYGWEEIAASQRGEIAELISQELAQEFDRRHLDLVSFGIREVHLPAPCKPRSTRRFRRSSRLSSRSTSWIRPVSALSRTGWRRRAWAALRATAESEAEATLTRARAQAEANALLAESITPELIRYEQLQRWDGKLPVFQRSNANPLIDVSSIVSDPVAAGQ